MHTKSCLLNMMFVSQCVGMKCVHLDECTCSIYGLPAVIMRPITQLQLPRQLIPYGASATLAAKPGALEVATVLLLETDHKAESIDEQVTINRGSCMQREAKKKKQRVDI